MECDCIQACPFFQDKMAMKPALAAVYKQRYCMDDFQACARHMVKDALGKPAVPADLFPNMEDRARQILAAAKPA